MDLAELLDENGLQQDEWSLSAPTFGKDGQLAVVGWSGKSGTNKFYILNCSVCSQDSELFGDGYFRDQRGNLERYNVPCGCGITRRSKAQYSTICTRKASELGYSFIRFHGEWRGSNSKIVMMCEKHGEWDTGTITKLVSSATGCPSCKTEASTKPHNIMVDSFFASGSFHPETKFWRSQRVDIKGCKAYWFMLCPECKQQGESTSSNLQKGKRPCECSPMRQRECYINWVKDGENIVAIKFGVANSSHFRIKSQSRKTCYHLINHSVYSFPTKQSCRKAELECRQELECGVVLRRDMEDGWSETTWAYNLGKIIEIYERNGGVEIEKTTNT